VFPAPGIQPADRSFESSRAQGCAPVTEEVAMGISTSIVVFAVGAILRFAVTATATGFNVQTVGDILMSVAALGFVLSIVFWTSWGSYGTGWSSRRTTVSRSHQDLYGQADGLGRTVVTRTEHQEVV
jgi:hypothetical protein